jgi:hypothetical protein
MGLLFDPYSSTHYPLSTIHYPLSTIHYPLSTIHYPLSTTHYPPLTTHHHLVRKPFNPQSSISHLTNSNGCGNLPFKVLLTVSPTRPYFPRQPRVCSRNRRLLPSYAPRNASISPVFSTLRILPVATGVSLLWHSPYMSSPPLCPLCFRLSRPGRGGKSHVFSGLQPLYFSLRSFSRSVPLFSSTCRLFCQNRGGGVAPLPVFTSHQSQITAHVTRRRALNKRIAVS